MYTRYALESSLQHWLSQKTKKLQTTLMSLNGEMTSHLTTVQKGSQAAAKRMRQVYQNTNMERLSLGHLADGTMLQQQAICINFQHTLTAFSMLINTCNTKPCTSKNLRILLKGRFWLTNVYSPYILHSSIPLLDIPHFSCFQFFCYYK